MKQVAASTSREGVGTMLYGQLPVDVSAYAAVVDGNEASHRFHSAQGFEPVLTWTDGETWRTVYSRPAR